MRLLLFATLMLVHLVSAHSQTLDSIASKVNLFATNLPQEKVFLHTDNSAYFLGDTIRYQAYVTRTDRNILSSLSGVLYVELLNADGYLVERQIVQLRQGMGEGSIELTTGRAHYAGYYELRAYTRWMLNFGRTTLPHRKSTEKLFVRRQMAHDFYVDYDKLYSRVFPVYDAPLAPGEYYPDMTQRPMQRLVSKRKEDTRARVAVYPEGGQLVAGLPNRLYFEASTAVGRHVRGTLTVSASGRTVATAGTEHRGKGVVEFTPKAGVSYSLTFQTPDGQTVTADMPQVQASGATMQPYIEDGSLRVETATAGDVPPLTLAITHQGVVAAIYENPIVLGDLPQGVLGLTLYDASGRIWADRLVCNTFGLEQNRLLVEGMKSEYKPFEKIEFSIGRAVQEGRAVVSVALVDGDNSNLGTDNGNILTEMLLCSEIKGFIEEPDYYFEVDDSAHRRHLDLLCATQGWRRFAWQELAHPERFVVAELNEPQTPRLNGGVFNYEAITKEDGFQEDSEEALDELISQIEDMNKEDDEKNETDGNGEKMDATRKEIEDRIESRDPYKQKLGGLKKEVTVHAEFVSPGNEPLVGEATTERSLFNIQQPDFDGQFYMHLAAADTTGWESGKPVKKARKSKHEWVMADESLYPDYYVRVADPFPRHAKSYSFYQTSLAESGSGSIQMGRQESSAFDDRQLDELVVRSGRTGKRRFDAKHPALADDAYTLYNNVCDAGLCPGQFVGAERFASDIAHLLVGDMGVARDFKLDVRFDGLPKSHTISDSEREKFNSLENLDSVYVYTDYAPRLYGNSDWDGAEQPEVVVDLRRIAGGGQRYTYRDRFYIRQGFNVCEDFYQPDYSQAVPERTNDTRRTLVWLPATMMGADGVLRVTGWNNGKVTHPRLTVNGIDTRGRLLTNGSQSAH